jgi:hypothetical protein
MFNQNTCHDYADACRDLLLERLALSALPPYINLDSQEDKGNVNICFALDQPNITNRIMWADQVIRAGAIFRTPFLQPAFSPMSLSGSQPHILSKVWITARQVHLMFVRHFALRNVETIPQAQERSS